MKFNILKSFILILIILFLGALTVYANESNEKENIETNYITINVLTDTFKDEKVLSKKEIDNLINSSVEKFLIDNDLTDVNHSAREVNITYSVDLNEGDAETLINTSLYNFIKSLKNFDYYDFNFDIYVKYIDKNYRTVKTKYASYTFNRETLGKFNWEEISILNFVSFADRIWTDSNGEESINKEIQTDELQLKILEIFKSYIQYKIGQK